MVFAVALEKHYCNYYSKDVLKKHELPGAIADREPPELLGTNDPRCHSTPSLSRHERAF